MMTFDDSAACMLQIQMESNLMQCGREGGFKLGMRCKKKVSIKLDVTDCMAFWET